MTPDSTGARLRALNDLIEQFDDALYRCALYGNADQVRDRWAALRSALLLVSESHQQIGCENDMPWELCIDCKAKQAQSVSESPSCMVCGQTKPFKASHGNYPSIGVCYACHDAREILGAIVASAYRHPPEGVQPRDCALQLVPTELIVKAEVLLS